jgi:hypothetical protein
MSQAEPTSLNIDKCVCGAAFLLFKHAPEKDDFLLFGFYLVASRFKLRLRTLPENIEARIVALYGKCYRYINNIDIFGHGFCFEV